MPGLFPDDIRSGISQPRNKKLAEIFHRLHLIESYGSGIRKIYALYKDQAVQPRIGVTSNTFKIVLPNMNSSANIEGSANAKAITPQMQKILDFIDDKGQITDGEIEELLQIKGTRRYNLVKQMEADGLIVVKGRGINKVYLKI